MIGMMIRKQVKSVVCVKFSFYLVYQFIKVGYNVAAQFADLDTVFSEVLLPYDGGLGLKILVARR